MQHRSTQIASKAILILFVAFAPLLCAKEIPITKQVTIEIPVGEFSIFRFPFEILKVQPGPFIALEKKKKQNTRVPKNSDVRKISLSANSKKTQKSKSNILNFKKNKNILTFTPVKKGSIEIVIWGNKAFPIIMHLNVVDSGDGDKNLEFIQVLDSRDSVIEFESSPHEKIIEFINRYLYNSAVNKKPKGYEEIVRKEIYDVGIKDRSGNTFARVRVSLNREILGKRYVGQEWNVNIVPEFDNEQGTVSVSDNFRLNLYEEMFDSPGVFSISLETYKISKKHGTRVFIVRQKERD